MPCRHTDRRRPLDAVPGAPWLIGLGKARRQCGSGLLQLWDELTQSLRARSHAERCHRQGGYQLVLLCHDRHGSAGDVQDVFLVRDRIALGADFTHIGHDLFRASSRVACKCFAIADTQIGCQLRV